MHDGLELEQQLGEGDGELELEQQHGEGEGVVGSSMEKAKAKSSAGAARAELRRQNSGCGATAELTTIIFRSPPASATLSTVHRVLPWYAGPERAGASSS